MSASAWLTAFACLILAISVPGFILSAQSMVRSARRLRCSRDDRIARFENGWEGTFAFLFGLASCKGLAIVLVLNAGQSGIALAGVVVVNLLVQPVALLFCWAGVRKVALGLFGQIAYAWQRIPESELAGLPQSERRTLAWYCVFQGTVGFAFGAAMSIGCALLLIEMASR